MENLAVIGCGTMGHSIGLAAAWAGMNVKVYGVDAQDINHATHGLDNKLRVMVANALFDEEEAEDIRRRITFLTSLDESVEEATFIIEAIPEALEMKHDLYHTLEQRVSENVVIASNTSGFTPTALAEDAVHPERMIVTHFWNPGHLIPLVEVVKGAQTAQSTVDRAMALMTAMKKHPILIHKEIPGFIGNRLQYALFREAQFLLDEGVASKEDIDAAVTYSIGRRLPVTGPLMTADMGGLDVFSAISDYLFKDLSTMKKSGKMLSKFVDAGHFGQKCGKGFYVWDDAFSDEKNTEREQMLIQFLKRDEKMRDRNKNND
ncbi:3-hydroxybutyryl-CoA dehydrogenase [Pullulanibacillus pueri]|uniref:L-gulonate 3-dehydrogenase n=1 Tax=Pullulanibacillus pueri TaxID=1437324 RepID=A0A8J2ZV51_9BACL|nr:3-hydroxyacyl-CoA dehydrogenase NAD-binding domain-containing protein [Pullulanibacillus pueri]MBM7682126.1 3-hydroxybutyryl-CoA dehydrogenase [Pullulanibacillus pueri]GGH79873.1 butyryl-CoA dehydrogenase [Pullulanibacillus pueri]